MFVAPHCLPIVLPLLIKGWTIPTIYGKEMCMAQLFLRWKQNPCARHWHKSCTAEKGKTGNALFRRTQLLCVFANTETLLTLRCGKPSPQQRHDQGKKAFLGEIARQRLQLLLLGSSFLKNCHSSNSPLRALEGQCQSLISPDVPLESLLCNQQIFISSLCGLSCWHNKAQQHSSEYG